MFKIGMKKLLLYLFLLLAGCSTENNHWFIECSGNLNEFVSHVAVTTITNGDIVGSIREKYGAEAIRCPKTSQGYLILSKKSLGDGIIQVSVGCPSEHVADGKKVYLIVDENLKLKKLKDPPTVNQSR
jgi:hypothetical protein